MVYLLYSKNGDKPIRLGKLWFGREIPWQACSIDQFMQIEVISDHQIFVYLEKPDASILEEYKDFIEKYKFVIFTGNLENVDEESIRKLSHHGVLLDERSLSIDLVDMYLSQGSIIRKNYEILRESEKNMQNFLAFLAHEIRTPLTSIMGAADLYFTEKRSSKKRCVCKIYYRFISFSS